jgi:ribosomal protein L32
VAAPAPASCPKCGAARRGGQACPRCGLSADPAEAYAKVRDAPVPEAVVAAWDRVLEAWDDADRHDALLRLVARHEAYAWAAARYREAKRAAPDPDHAVDAVADRQLDRMRRAALATLLASASAREERGRPPYRAATAILAMLIVAIVAGLIFAAMLQRNEPAGAGARAGQATPAEAQPAGPAQPAPRK